jgi:hypothetical protein
MSRYKRQWLSPMKLREYYVNQFVPNVRDAEYQLFWAVVNRDIRARHSGRLLTPEEANALCKKSWSSVEGDIYALPPDLELSVEDAEHIWMEVDTGNAQPDGGPPERQRQPRSQPGRKLAKDAIAALYPNGVPDSVSNKLLYKAVGDKCQQKGRPDISKDTILRAAGRRK